MSLNQILLIGNAGRDAELRYTQNGTPVTNFSMAVNRRYQVRDEMREDTEWFNVSVWERQAEWAAESIRRGYRVFVDGRLSTREYISGNGETRVSLDVNARRILALTPREGEGEAENRDAGYPARNEQQGESGEAGNYAANGHVTSDYAPVAAAQVSVGPSDSGDDLENLPW